MMYVETKDLPYFYIGINIGAFLSGLIVGYVGEVHGWHYGFRISWNINGSRFNSIF